jgi:hypothetical protein
MTYFATKGPRETWGKQRSWQPSPEWLVIDVLANMVFPPTKKQLDFNGHEASCQRILQISHVKSFRKNGQWSHIP